MLVRSRNVASVRMDTKPYTTLLRKFTTGGAVPEAAKPEPRPLYGSVASHRSYIFLHASEPPSKFPARVSTPIQRALLLRVLKWGGIVNFAWHEDQGHQDPGSTSGTAFSIAGGQLEIPKISLENIDEVAENLKKHADGLLVKGTTEDIQLYVCTHGARDCRCGDIGSRFFSALREEVWKRTEMDPHGPVSKIKVAEVGHVGGHELSD